MNQKTEEQALAVQEGEILDSKNSGIVVRGGSLDYENFVGLWRLSKLLVMSGMVPKVKEGTSLEERTSQVAVSIARGRCVGLDAFQSVESIVPINGRPMIWGNAPLAICRQSPNWSEEGFDEYWEVKGQRQDSHPAKFDDDSITAVCETLRKGAKKPMIRRFSVADAKRAGLWGATGKLYGAYPQRLLPARARGYCLNDNFGDALKGIAIRETFEEEVDGKQPVSNVDELRDQIDKRKEKSSQQKSKEAFEAWEIARAEAVAKGEISEDEDDPRIDKRKESQEQADKRKILDTVKKPGFSYNLGVGEEHRQEKIDSIKNAGRVKVPCSNAAEAAKPLAGGLDVRRDISEPATISNRAKRLDQDLSELDAARDWLKTVYEKIPMKIDRQAALKGASLEDGTWISFEHIDSISDLEYLNRIAARLEEMLSQAASAKA